MSDFIKSFVRRGRKLSKIKAELCNTLLPQLKVEVLSLVERKVNVNLEIGFGNGKFLYSLAAKNPDEIFIGCEPYMQGVASLLEDIQEGQIDNILIWTNDARILIQDMPDDFLHSSFILFPDPWPKAKHHKRRIINKDFLNLLSEKMRNGSKLYLATDHAGYREWIIEVLTSHERFNKSEMYDWQKEFGEVETHYRKKAADRNIGSAFMCFTLSK